MDKTLALLASLAWLVPGCAGTYQQSGQSTTTAKPTAELDITRAGMPYKILRARGGQEIPAEAFYSELGAVDAICVGEQHTDPHHHWAQLEVLTRVSERRAGKATALGMEMFQRPFQGVLDDYAHKRISERDLLTRSGWDDRWGFDFALYGPILKRAVERGITLLALNVSTELRKKLSRGGMAALTEAERARIPELKLDDEEHIAWFDQALGPAGPHGSAPVTHRGDPTDQSDAPTDTPPLPEGHPPLPQDPPLPAGHPPLRPDPPLPEGHPPMPEGHPPMDRTHGQLGRGDQATAHGSEGGTAAGARPRNASMSVYRSQVLWDETMADTASQWLKGGSERQVVILAGYGHCHDSAIVRRMRRRGVARVVSVRPIVENSSGQLAAELAQPVADYLFVMTRPAAGEKTRPHP